MGQFFYSAKAFDVLEKIDPNPEYWEAKRGAVVGVFQLVIANKEPQCVFNFSKTLQLEVRIATVSFFDKNFFRGFSRITCLIGSSLFQ